MSIEQTTQIIATHTTEKEFEAYGLTWKATCRNYDIVVYGNSHEQVIDGCYQKIEQAYSKGTFKLSNQTGFYIEKNLLKVVVELKLGVNPNATLDEFMEADGREIDRATEEKDPAVDDTAAPYNAGADPLTTCAEPIRGWHN